MNVLDSDYVFKLASHIMLKIIIFICQKTTRNRNGAREMEGFCFIPNAGIVRLYLCILEFLRHRNLLLLEGNLLFRSHSRRWSERFPIFYRIFKICFPLITCEQFWLNKNIVDLCSLLGTVPDDLTRKSRLKPLSCRVGS